MAFGVYGVVVPSLSPAGFPAVALAQVLKDASVPASARGERRL